MCVVRHTRIVYKNAYERLLLQKPVKLSLSLFVETRLQYARGNLQMRKAIAVCDKSTEIA